MADDGICHFLFSMRIRSLKLNGFRNFGPMEVEFGDRVNILYGDNGSGKTNLIEGIFVLCLGRSQRGVADSVMVQDGVDTYRIEGLLAHNGEANSVAVAYQLGGRKRITIDEVPVRITDLYERYSAVSAGPEDTELLSGGPAARRTFLDIYLSQFSPRYLAQLVDYNRVLAQKNAALRNGTVPEAFNDLLIPLGAAITTARARFLERLEELTAGHYDRIANAPHFAMAYKASSAAVTEDMDSGAIAEQFARKVGSYIDRERIMQVSLVGPHRDDIVFEIGGFPARTHASQGELRTAAIALKLGVYQLLAVQREARPLLLLDEIFAELDDKRIAALVEALADFEQLFLTTASQPPAILREHSRRFEISNGRIAGVV